LHRARPRQFHETKPGKRGGAGGVDINDAPVSRGVKPCFLFSNRYRLGLVAVIPREKMDSFGKKVVLGSAGPRCSACWPRPRFRLAFISGMLLVRHPKAPRRTPAPVGERTKTMLTIALIAAASWIVDRDPRLGSVRWSPWNSRKSRRGATPRTRTTDERLTRGTMTGPRRRPSGRRDDG